MINQTYEHHLELREDKLCPFKFKKCEDTYNSICNWHQNVEMLLVTEGCGSIRYGSIDLAIEEHDLIIVNSEVLHHVYSDKGIGFVYVLIDESFPVENGIELKNHIFENKIRSDTLESLYLDAYKSFNEYKKSSSPINTAKARCSTLALIIELCANHTVRTKDRPKSLSISEKYVKETLSYLGDHFSEPIVLENLANRCGITPYHLTRVFKAYTGQTLFAYVNILRCKRAEFCLSKGMTVTETAEECGFESLSYFSRTYKKLMGHSPSSEK